MIGDPSASTALHEAREYISAAHEAAAVHDHHRQTHYARSAIDSAATTLIDNDATDRQVVAAHFFLAEGLALDGRPGQCGTDSIDIDSEALTLVEEDRRWLQTYLASARHRNARASTTHGYGRDL
mgnify:CR=1 FL=1